MVLFLVILVGGGIVVFWKCLYGFCLWILIGFSDVGCFLLVVEWLRSC